VRRHSTYSEQRRKRLTLKRWLGIIVLAFLVYEFITGIFLAPYRVESTSMTPTLSPGDQVMTFPLAFGPRIALSRMPLPGVSDPRRGDLVVVEAPFHERLPWWREMADSIVRFVTFQRVGLGGGRDGVNGISIKRVVAVPGDSLYMKNNEVMIRAAGSDHYLTEYEVSGVVYEAHASPTPEGWSGDFPLSGSYPEILLKDGQYFVLGDDRTGSVDSRAYGPVDRSRLMARLLFRYWPFHSFGRP
jgi:signal peptidase I